MNIDFDTEMNMRLEIITANLEAIKEWREAREVGYWHEHLDSAVEEAEGGVERIKEYWIESRHERGNI